MRIFLLALLFGAAAVAWAARRKPPAKELAELRSILATIQEFREQRLEASKKIKESIEIKVGLIRATGETFRPLPPDFDQSVASRGEIEAYWRSVAEFDKKVARGFAGLSAEEKERYALATREYQERYEDLAALYNKAIGAALKAYAISPRRASCPIAAGPPPPRTEYDLPGFVGAAATWAPVFRELRDPNAAAVTGYDGRVGVDPKAFQYADFLGAVLYHESLHFEELLTPGLDLRNEPEAEVRTEEKMRPLLGSIFVLTPKDMAARVEVAKQKRELADKWRQVMKNGFNPWNKLHRPAFPARERRHWFELEPGEEDVSSIVALDELRRQADVPSPGWTGAWREGTADAFGELGRREGRRREWRQLGEQLERERLAREKAGREFEVSRDPLWEALNSWTHAACRYIKSVELVDTASVGDPAYLRWAVAENDRRLKDKKSEDAATRGFLRTHFVVMSKEALAGRLKMEKSLDSCQRDLIGLLVEAEGPLDAEWLVQELDYRKGGGALGAAVKGILKAARSSKEAVVRGVKTSFMAIAEVGKAFAEFAASEGNPDMWKDSGRERSEAPEKREEPQPEPPPDASPRSIVKFYEKTAINQARGIASGKRGFD